MLAADKLLLQSNLRQNTIKLKEKEMHLHHGNFSTVGTQAAVLAGLTVTGLIEFQIPTETNRVLQFMYYFLCITSLGMNLNCVSSTTALSVFGTGLALRGPDGSMVRAVNGMYQERTQIFATFGVGLMSTVGAAIFASLIIMRIEAAAACSLVLLYCAHRIYTQAKRIFTRFSFEEDEGVSFDDILSAPLVNMLPKVRRHVQRYRDDGGGQENEKTPFV